MNNTITKIPKNKTNKLINQQQVSSHAHNRIALK